MSSDEGRRKKKKKRAGEKKKKEAGAWFPQFGMELGSSLWMVPTKLERPQIILFAPQIFSDVFSICLNFGGFSVAISRK